MKKFLFLVLAAILVFTNLTACGPFVDDVAKLNETGVIRIGMECDYAPFNWTQAASSDRTAAISGEGGYADGYDVQIAKYIAKELGVELQIVKIEWTGLVMALQSGVIDVIIAGMSPTAERKLTIDFSDPYYESELVVVMRADSAYAKAESLAGLSGARITGQQGTFHYSVIGQIPNVRKQTAMADFPTMITALNSNAIDGYISEKPGAVSAVKANGGLTFVQFKANKGFKTNPEDVMIAAGLKKGSNLTAKINEILKKLSKEDREQMMDDALDNQPLS